MTPPINARIDQLAESCVANMGDIFWDFDSVVDAAGQYTDPYQVALAAVKETLQEFAEQVDTSSVYPASLCNEYMALIADVGDESSNDEITVALIRDAAWTERGAREMIHLARQYGTSIL